MKTSKKLQEQLMNCPKCGREIVKIRPCMYCEHDELKSEKCYSCGQIPDLFGRCKCCNKDSF